MGVKKYAVTVDGEALHLAPLLCVEHGERFLIRTGFVIASLTRLATDIFKEL